ncbi:thioesterase II family protein [Paenibacillus agilis]|nr:alpha/beta fold hydrolase [Paenibacillus agilis]
MKNNLFQLIKPGNGNNQVICFPYLGGNVYAYNQFANSLHDDVEVWAVNPPGHGGDTNALIADIHTLLDLYFEQLITIIKPQAILFGHSMGGIIAYLLAQKLHNTRDYDLAQMKLVLSACNPPNEYEMNKYTSLTNDKLIEHLISYGGVPEELIHEKNILEFLLPTIRADYGVLETASTLEIQPIRIPTYYFWGENDSIVPVDSITSWLSYFDNELQVIPIENGSHMFISAHADVVAHQMEQIIFREEQ